MSLIKKFFLLSLKGKLILKIEIILLITDELFTNLIVKSKYVFILNNIEGKKNSIFWKNNSKQRGDYSINKKMI